MSYIVELNGFVIEELRRLLPDANKSATNIITTLIECLDEGGLVTPQNFTYVLTDLQACAEFDKDNAEVYKSLLVTVFGLYTVKSLA